MRDSTDEGRVGFVIYLEAILLEYTGSVELLTISDL
jgi:hypothetical protein